MFLFWINSYYTVIEFNVQSLVDLNRKMLRSLTCKSMCEYLLRVHILCIFTHSTQFHFQIFLKVHECKIIHFFSKQPLYWYSNFRHSFVVLFCKGVKLLPLKGAWSWVLGSVKVDRIIIHAHQRSILISQKLLRINLCDCQHCTILSAAFYCTKQTSC